MLNASQPVVSRVVRVGQAEQRHAGYLVTKNQGDEEVTQLVDDDPNAAKENDGAHSPAINDQLLVVAADPGEEGTQNYRNQDKVEQHLPQDP